MSKETVEICFAYSDDEKLEIQNGIYVFADWTIKQLIEFAKNCDNMPDFIEIGTDQFME